MADHLKQEDWSSPFTSPGGVVASAISGGREERRQRVALGMPEIGAAIARAGTETCH